MFQGIHIFHKNRKMQLGFIGAMYLGCIVLSIAIVVFVSYSFSPDQSSAVKTSVEYIKEGWTITYPDKTSAPASLPTTVPDIKANQSLILSTQIKHQGGSDPTLAFHTEYVTVDVLLNGINLYHYGAVQRPFGALPVKSWHFVSLPSNFNQGRLDVILTSSLNQKIVLSDFILGTKNACVFSILSAHMLTSILCLLIFFLGIIIIVAHFFVRFKNTPGLYMNYIGFFAIVSAIWIISESGPLRLFFDNTYAIYLTSFLSFMLMPIPLFLFFKYTYRPKYSRLLDIMSSLMILNFIVLTVLCVFNIADFKQTLLSTHILLALSISVLLFLIINELKKNKRSMRLVLIGIISVLLAGIAGLICYYSNIQTNAFYVMPIATLILISTFAADALLIGLKMYARTIEADTLEYLAYNDIMTNLKNRGAFEKRLGQLQNKLVEGSKIGLAIIDINNLKQTNDTMGHQIGDELIIRCADAIAECFRRIGTIYRIGGDEFCVLMENASSSVVKECVTELEEKLEVLSEQTGLSHSISIGYCTFDPKIDEDLVALFKRADKEMYKCKVRNNSFYRRSTDVTPPKQ